MRFNTLEDWLSWQETLHPSEIELGLARVGEVLARLNLQRPDFTLITVAGTNGKGSSVAMLESILRAAGYRVGSYTSPHLLRYNERIKVDGQLVDDATLCASFERIDQARVGSSDVPQKNISLSYFEFGTLAAIDILHRSALDIAILEVGLGGRLDAVNILDADVALITAIDVDHVEWLGNDREVIGGEKAGILRAGRPAVCADPNPPASILAMAESLGTPLSLLGSDYHIEVNIGKDVEKPTLGADRSGSWNWKNRKHLFDRLPLPALQGDFQLNNAAGVLAVLSDLASDFPVDPAAVARGLQMVSLPGRFQIVAESPLQIFDVAHNVQSAQALVVNLSQRNCNGLTRVVLGMLADKDIESVVAELWPVVDHWYLAPLPAPRSASVKQLQAAVRAASSAAAIITPNNNDIVETFDDVSAAYQAALHSSRAQDRIVVTGSFYSVAVALGEAV